MSYPTLEEYTQALQSPQFAFLDSELKRGTVKKSGLGIPRALCGGFALTFQVTCSNNVYAVRCFHQESKNLERRYDAISRKIDSLKSDYFVDFNFLSNGVKVNGKVAPIVKMRWSQGDTLGDFVCDNYDDRKIISILHKEIIKLSYYLESQNIAHGDIQPGNIMISGFGGKINLIDYDGMYVDELKNIQSSEIGMKNFQHPLRNNQWNAKLDRFSFILLDLIFDILEFNPRLWNETQSNQEMFLFSANDFADPLHSSIIHKVKGYDCISRKVDNFISICRCKFDDIPSLKDFISGNISILERITSIDSVTVKVYINSFPVLNAVNFDKCYAFIGHKVELIGKIYDIRRAKTVKGDDYVFVNFSDWRGKAVKLNIWSDGLAIVSGVIDKLHKDDWLSVSGLIEAPFSKEYIDYYTNTKRTYTHLSITINHPSQITIISQQDANFRLNNYKFDDPGIVSFDGNIFDSDINKNLQINNISNNSFTLKNIRNISSSHFPSQSTVNNAPKLNQSVRNSQQSNKQPVNNKDILANIHNISSTRPSQQSSSQRSSSVQNASQSCEKEKKSGKCFITSAVCAALNKPDDCIELNAFRKFRNEARESSIQVSVLIDEYYRVAPLIIAEIENNESSLDTYRLIWENHISKFYLMLKKGNYKDVLFGYIYLTVGLCDEYGVELSREIETIISELEY